VRGAAYTGSAVLKLARLVMRTLRAVKLVATNGKIPRPLRWLLLAGALPVPGPFDEAVLLILAVPSCIFYRPELKDAWRRTEGRPG
jgi:hypothetical protein